MNDEFLFQASTSIVRRVLRTAGDSSPFTSRSKGLPGLIYNASAGRWDKQVRVHLREESSEMDALF
jgi:hypothetical protein